MTPIERSHVERLVREILYTAYYDDQEVISLDIINEAHTVAEILGLNLDDLGNDIESEDYSED